MNSQTTIFSDLFVGPIKVALDQHMQRLWKRISLDILNNGKKFYGNHMFFPNKRKLKKYKLTGL